MADRPIPARSEVPEESTWNLKDVFESDEAWQAEYEAFKAVPEQIEAFRGRLGESAETLLEWFRLNDALSVRLEKLYGYASCKGDEDTGNSVYQGMRRSREIWRGTVRRCAGFFTKIFFYEKFYRFKGADFLHVNFLRAFFPLWRRDGDAARGAKRFCLRLGPERFYR